MRYLTIYTYTYIGVKLVRWKGKEMEIKYTTFKGRHLYIGVGTYEEVEALNIEKDFNHVLSTLRSIKHISHRLLGLNCEEKVDRSIVGLRSLNDNIMKRDIRGTRKAV